MFHIRHLNCYHFDMQSVVKLVRRHVCRYISFQSLKYGMYFTSLARLILTSYISYWVATRPVATITSTKALEDWLEPKGNRLTQFSAVEVSYQSVGFLHSLPIPTDSSGHPGLCVSVLPLKHSGSRVLEGTVRVEPCFCCVVKPATFLCWCPTWL